MDVNRYLNWLLGGCGKEREKLELQSILYQLAEEMHRGNASEEEVKGLISKLCEEITVLAQQCGKMLTHEECVDQVFTAVRVTVTPGAMMMRMRETIRSWRSGRGRASETSIL